LDIIRRKEGPMAPVTASSWLSGAWFKCQLLHLLALGPMAMLESHRVSLRSLTGKMEIKIPVARAAMRKE
jgi:hypothetical protein